MIEFIDIKAFNKEAIDWSRGTRADLLRAMKTEGVEKYSGALFSGLSYKNKKREGIVYRLSFPFPKHGIFVKLGVGNGTPISKAGTPQTNRKPKNWIDKTLDKKIIELADKIQPYYANAAINAFGETVTRK